MYYLKVTVLKIPSHCIPAGQVENTAYSNQLATVKIVHKNIECPLSLEVSDKAGICQEINLDSH